MTVIYVEILISAKSAMVSYFFQSCVLFLVLLNLSNGFDISMNVNASCSFKSFISHISVYTP